MHGVSFARHNIPAWSGKNGVDSGSRRRRYRDSLFGCLEATGKT